MRKGNEDPTQDIVFWSVFTVVLIVLIIVLPAIVSGS